MAVDSFRRSTTGAPSRATHTSEPFTSQSSYEIRAKPPMPQSAPQEFWIQKPSLS